MAFKMSEEEKKIRDELKELRKEIVSVSAVDEFARYARIQRKMNKLEEQLMSRGQSRMDGRESIRWKLTKAIQVVNVMFSFSQMSLNSGLHNFFLQGRRSSLPGRHPEIRTRSDGSSRLVLAIECLAGLPHWNRRISEHSLLAFHMQQCLQGTRQIINVSNWNCVFLSIDSREFAFAEIHFGVLFHEPVKTHIV